MPKQAQENFDKLMATLADRPQPVENMVVTDLMVKTLNQMYLNNFLLITLTVISVGRYMLSGN